MSLFANEVGGGVAALNSKVNPKPNPVLNPKRWQGPRGHLPSSKPKPLGRPANAHAQAQAQP